ncbi:MAG: hypothetical protein JNN08_18690 [Bryobacterales bacterium]|nr:hypothetical protein [Bryobacterales bacterium]
MAARIQSIEFLMQTIPRILTALLLALPLAGQDAFGDRRSRIDELTADPETKFQTLDAMAATLGTHRNRLILLKKESGRSFAEIYADELRRRGASEPAIAEKFRQVAEMVVGTRSGWADPTGLRPIAYIGSTVDRNSAGTFITLAPELGVDFGKRAIVVGVPIYRISATQRDSTGIGDAYVAAFLRQPVRRYDLGIACTVSAPTGSKDEGLGTGRVSVDLNGTVQRKLESLRPFVTGGYTNSTFNNIGYQRPFISNGNAVYTSGGVDYTIRRRWTAGVGGFALHAVGSQTVISRMFSIPHAAAVPGVGGTGPGMPGMGHGTPGQQSMPSGTPTGTPIYGHALITTVTAQDVSDHGVAARMSWSPRPDVTFSLRIAHSFPYELTTIRFGIGLDVSRSLKRILP